MKIILALLFLTITACGDDGGTGGDDVASFIGAWTYNAGSTTTVDCQDNRFDSTDISTGTFQVTSGTMSDLIVVPEADDKCPAQRFDVVGNVASIQSGQTCMYTQMESGLTFTFTGAYSMGTYTLSADKLMVSGSQSGSLMVSGAVTTTCSVSGSMSATKVGN